MGNQQETNQTSKKSRAKIEASVVAKAWQDEYFRQELLSNPQEVISREFNVEINESTNIQVLEESNDTYYLVIPQKPDVEEELSEEELEAVAGGWCKPDPKDWIPKPDPADWIPKVPKFPYRPY